jgi:hypothetical protein
MIYPGEHPLSIYVGIAGPDREDRSGCAAELSVPPRPDRLRADYRISDGSHVNIDHDADNHHRGVKKVE